jgi:hypothetical protein
MIKRDNVRLWLGALVAPAIPMIVIATLYWMNTGNGTWFLLFFTFGYFFTFLFGLPVMGFLIKKKRFLSCLVGGGITSVLPIILLAMFSIFSKNTIFNVEMIKGVGVLFVSGCVGGALFWVIAFSERRKPISAFRDGPQ